MVREPNKRPLRDMWHHFTDDERRVLQDVLKRSPVPRGTETTAGVPLTFGQRVADMVTDRFGSWSFIIVQSVILLIWIVVNTIAWRQHWDPYPFILLNEEYLAERVQELRNQNCAATAAVLTGSAAGTLLDAIRPDDLVVLTTHARGGVRRWLLGSVVDELVRAAAAPVLLVPAMWEGNAA